MAVLKQQNRIFLKTMVRRDKREGVRGARQQNEERARALVQIAATDACVSLADLLRAAWKRIEAQVKNKNR